MMDAFVRFLSDQPLLVLFVVIGAGYFLGSVRVFGFSLGPAAVLFSGIAVGALDAELRIPEFIPILGLILFVYTTGLQSGSAFFSSFGTRGVRANLLAVGVLCLAAALCAAAARLWGVEPALVVGVFTGSLTNTPALASSIEAIRNATIGYPTAAASLNAPVIGYGVTYPFGVIGVLLGFYVFERFARPPDSPDPTSWLSEESAGPLMARSYRVTNAAAIGVPVKKIESEEPNRMVVFSRVKHAGAVSLVDGNTVFQHGDIVTAVCVEPAHARVQKILGEVSEEALQTDRDQLDYRRIEISDRKVVGRKIRELNLQERFEATITRLRRGDVDFVPSGDTVLEHGDRVRVLTHPQNIEQLTKYFGDSIRSGSEADFFSVSLGIVLGALLGLLPVPLPGGSSFSLGFAGGPLIVGLVLGRVQRTGPIIWGMPFSANLTLRQIGLVLFLAGVGTKAGDGFIQTLSQGGWRLALIGGAVTTATTLMVLLFGHRCMKLPTSAVMGLMAGIQTQPACLAYVSQRTSTNLPELWYSTVYPAAMIAKIILAQLLVRLLV
jgi:putative transport protein